MAAKCKSTFTINIILYGMCMVTCRVVGSRDHMVFPWQGIDNGCACQCTSVMRFFKHISNVTCAIVLIGLHDTGHSFDSRSVEYHAIVWCM